ncbi:hypothetical protein [Saccharothrix syringae]|uniref:Uncharacterized protein n=1 Tax=Saccharothrix syringae TaxID=103733 RepID=A0A5Q0GZR0_SACSY|nr:hypothetical protein [Saccharothrix syringae]QFZ19409.1 hypothetical protein EKG83_19960 [Saccharothrix syringae]
MEDTAACTATRYANELHATVEDLAIGRRWPLVLADGNVHLPTGRGIAGLVVDARLAAQVPVELPALALTPVLWAFLVDVIGVHAPVLPPYARLVTGGRYLPLPPSVTADGPVRWVRRPGGALPRLSSVLDLLRPLTPTVRIGRGTR